MIGNLFSAKAALCKVDADFVDVRVRQTRQRRRGPGRTRGRGRGKKITYRVQFKFKIYINLFEALLDEIDQIELTISEKDRFTMPYFNDPKSPSSVSNDINAFFTKTKTALAKKAREQAIATRRFSVLTFLNNETISQISNGIITLENYEQFLPERDILSVQNLKDVDSQIDNPLDTITSTISTGSLDDSRDAEDLAYDVFDANGYDPAMIANVRFPAYSNEDAADGIASSVMNPPQKIIPSYGSAQKKAPNAFYELYSRFVNSSDPNSFRYSLVEESAHIKFIPVDFRVTLTLDRQKYNELIQKSKLFLILRFKSKGSPAQVETFSWNNKFEFTKLSGIYQDLILNVKPGDFSIAEPDMITVKNPNNFPVKYKLYECYINKGRLNSKNISNGLLRGRRSIELEDISTIFGSNSQSRSYRVIAWRNIPGGQPICNFSDIEIPSTTDRPAYDSLSPSVDVLKSGPQTATISVRSIPKDATLIKIFRKNLGAQRLLIPRYLPNGADDIGRALPEDISRNFLVGTLTNAGTIEDAGNLYHNSTYQYTAKFYSNGADIPVEASDVIHYMDNSGISGYINFNIANKSTELLENSVAHHFSIEETVDPSVADLLLGDVSSIGQAGNFASELEAAKEETGTVTQYKIVRINSTRGRKKVITEEAQPNVSLKYTVTKNISDTYKYRISMNAAPAAALSYKTVATKIDQESGRTYKFLYRKWRGQETIDREALPAYSEIVKNSTKRALRSAPGGSFTTVAFSTSIPKPKVKQFSVEADPFNKCNWLRWAVSGRTKTIDHFLIVAFYNGVQAPIGVGANWPSKGRNYVYRDTRLFGLLGTVTYQIIIVNKKFTYDDSASEANVVKLSSFPQFALLKG